MNQPYSLQKILVDANRLHAQLLAYDPHTHLPEDNDLENGLAQIFDYFIWAQKHSSDLLQQLLEIGILGSAQHQVMKDRPLGFLKNYILLMMNCIEGGKLAQHILNEKLPHLLLQTCLRDVKVDETEELVEYLGSFLKAYNRVFCPEFMDKFIFQHEYFELLEICCKFYNCPQELTRTTVFNIVLHLISHECVRSFIHNTSTRKMFYQRFTNDMCKLFRNQLAEYCLRLEHASKDDKVELVLKQLDDKISLWEDISTHGAQMFRNSFTQEVILPILVGAIKTDKMPLFTLKFALLVLNKLIPTISQFGLIQTLIEMIFIREDIRYQSSSLFKASLKPFCVQKLFIKDLKSFHDHDEEEDFGNRIKSLFGSIMKTKDNHFLIMVCAFISNLVKELNKDPELREKLGFNLKGNGRIIKQLIETLMNRLTEVHRIHTILAILNTIVIMSNFEILQSDQHNLYIFTFKQILLQAKNALKSRHQFWDHLLECLEYDLVFVDEYQFQSNNNQHKYENLFKIVFSWDVTKQEDASQQFYSSIPETQDEYLRYLYLKFIIMLKGRSVLLEGRQKDLSLFLTFREETNYYVCPYIPGETRNFKEIGYFDECQIIENENKVPSLFIEDPRYIVFGFNNRKEKKTKIMIKVKMKHTHAKLVTKKSKIYLQFTTMKFNQVTGRVEKNNVHLVRGIESKLSYLAAHQNINREAELKFITGLLKRTEETLPSINLL